MDLTHVLPDHVFRERDRETCPHDKSVIARGTLEMPDGVDERCTIITHPRDGEFQVHIKGLKTIWASL